MRKPEHAEWIRFALRDKGDKPIAELANVLVALKHDPDLRDVFAFNEMSQAVVLLPGIPGSFHDGMAGPLTDLIVSRLQERLQRDGLHHISREVVHQAIDLHAAERHIHPLKDWLASLEWDGTPRVVDWLHFYLGADHTPYTEEVGRSFLISMIARIFEPGAKADHMIVLEGPQGIMKSTAARVLAGDEYFSDSLPDIQASMKDARAHLHGKWLVEIAELASFSRAEAALLKQFITTQIDIFRPPYGRLDVQKPRSCVFIGTTNEKSYLKDRTGGRRFWPVRCGEIDIEALKADREQIFAEAMRLYTAGIKWWPDREFEQQHIRREQEARRELDPWLDTLSAFLVSRTTITLTDLQQQALDIKTERMGTRERNRLIDCLEELGWRASELKDPPTRRTLYVKTTN